MIKRYYALLFIVILVVFRFDADARRRKRSTPDRGGNETVSRGATISRESAVREYIDRLETTLSRLAYDMDDYDFDRIHRHLFSVYQCYAGLDTLSGAVKRSLADTTLSIASGRKAKAMQTQAFIDSFIIKMEQLKKSDSTGDTVTIVDRPVIRREKDTTATRLTKLKTGFINLLETGMQDSGKSVVVTTTEKPVPQNYIEYEVEKLKEKTAGIHRYFDAGEFSMSRSELEWLISYLSGVKMDIINHVVSRKEAASDGSHTGE